MKTTQQVADELGIDRSPSSLIAINPSNLHRVADHIRASRIRPTHEQSTWDDNRFWNSQSPIADRSQYFAVGSAINFRFWKLDDSARFLAQSGTLHSTLFHGSMYMWRALRLCLSEERFPILDATSLAAMTEHDFDGLFRDDLGNNPLSPGKTDRIRNLNDLGHQLQTAWQGSFYNLVQEARDSLTRFAQLLSTFRAFDDPLYKLTMLAAILLQGSGITTFNDHVLPAIDYHLVKQLLRQGILQPRADLAKVLQERKTLAPNEAYEVRRAALSAFVELSELTGLPGSALDNLWWWNRLKCTLENPVCLDPETASQCPFYGSCDQLVDYFIPLEKTRYY